MGLSTSSSTLGLFVLFLTRLNEITYLKGWIQCWVLNKHPIEYQVLSKQGERKEEMKEGCGQGENGNPDWTPTRNEPGTFITITTWNMHRITEKFGVETKGQGCFLFFLKFGDMKWRGRDEIFFRLSPDSYCCHLRCFEICPKTISARPTEEYIPHHTWDPHRHTLSSTRACTRSQGIFKFLLAHIHMHTRRGLSSQGQCFSLWESKAVTLWSLWIDYLSILSPPTRSSFSAMCYHSPWSFLSRHLAEFIITQWWARLFD